MAITAFNLLTRSRFKIAVLLLIFCNVYLINGQDLPYGYFYRVYFRDKGDNSTENYEPGDLLSARAINRRLKAGITVPDFRDLPVYAEYLNQVSSSGLKLHCTSKWMNTALFKSSSVFDINALLKLPFVSSVRIVKTPGAKNNSIDKLSFQTEISSLFSFDRPLTMLNGDIIHNSGFDGKGILIAVLDGGFINSDIISSLNDLRNRNGIKATYNFVNKNKTVYGYHNHGTAVLSVLAGELDGILQGTAPGAEYLLLKTEDVESEFPVEEDFWAAGAEFADSAGVDIISSSLGYFSFDNPALNYKYSDLDGNTSFITKVADIAASKGILVVNSAGNERNNDWQRIIFPADGDSVLAIGAVDGYNIISSFSSAGPSADNRIKPDIAAMGVSVPAQISSASVERLNGTSLACPVISGMAACLLQAVPRAVNTDLLEILRYSGNKYDFPDSLYGYGIPDMVKALTKLQDKYIIIPDNESVVGPNPTTGNIEITFLDQPELLSVEIISLAGKIVFTKEFLNFAGRSLQITELQNMEQGIYFVRIKIPASVTVHKIIKLSN
jgi:serine protease AprX